MKQAIGAVLFLILITPHAVSQDVLPERYHTCLEVLDTLADLRNSYPEILYLDTLGYSNRDSIPMLRLKISDNPQIDEDEPAVFFDGGVHADEVLGVEVVVKFVQDIVDRYSRGDTAVARYIQELEIFAVPFINPEGHMVVEGGDLRWRKNKSDNDTNSVFDFHDGVDNNRNYDFGWSIDDDATANSPESLEFKGYYPFSESENRAMSNFAWQYRPVIALDYHSPTFGRPNVAYYPWYWYSSDGGHGFGPDELLMQSICQSFASLIQAIPDDSGTVVYTARRALVNKGDFKTYFYGNFGAAAFSVEISDTTIQDSSLVDSIVTAHLPGQYYLLRRALGPAITGIVRDSVTLEPIEAEVQVLQHINADINPRLSRPDFGRYHRLLAPGSYTLSFIKDGYRTKTIYGVTVTSAGPTATDVSLYPLNPRPPSPELIYPNQGDSLADSAFTFDWSDPAYASRYLLEVSPDTTFTVFVIQDSAVSQSEYVVATALGQGQYHWRVKGGNTNGWGPYSDIRTFVIVPSTGISGNGSLPADFQLYQNRPNPFNSSTRINFTLAADAEVQLEIFDLTGALVASPINEHFRAGEHSVIWNGVTSGGQPAASGLYFYRLKTGIGSATMRMILLK